MIDNATLAEWAKNTSLDFVSERLRAAIAEIRRLREAPLDFTGHDHPGANGQRPTPGAFEWTFSFTLEDGRTLKVHVGERGFRAFEEMFLKNRAADYQERDQLKADLAAHRAVIRELVVAAKHLMIGGFIVSCEECREAERKLAHPLVVAAREGAGDA